MSNILTHSGDILDLLAPDKSAIHLQDIALGLSNTCRFSGQVKPALTVAQHSILVARLSGEVGSNCYKWGLFHDAPEAYMCDLSSPLKGLLIRYQNIELMVMNTVADKFELMGTMPPHVKRQDKLATVSEAAILLDIRKEPVLWEDFPEPIENFISIDDLWGAEKAEIEFLKAAKECGYEC